MEITHVNIRMMDELDQEPYRRLKAMASVTFEGLLSIDDIKVIQGNNRLCVMYPENKYHQAVVVPRVREFSRQIEDAILDNYRRKAGLLDKQEA